MKFLYTICLIAFLNSCSSKKADSKEVEAKIDEMAKQLKLQIENEGSADCEKLIIAEVAKLKESSSSDVKKKLSELKTKEFQAKKEVEVLKSKVNQEIKSPNKDMNEIDMEKNELKNAQSDIFNSK